MKDANDNVWTGIANYAVPYLLAYFLQMLYGLTDLYIVGQYADVAATTSVAIGSQVMHFLTVVIVGLAMGTTVVVARATGARDTNRISSTIGTTFTMFMSLSVVLAAVLCFDTASIAVIMSTPTEAMSGTQQYLAICFAGIPAITAYNVIASIFRGMGDSRTPLVFVAIACVANIAFDYLLIGYFNMDAAGAALATVMAQTLSVVMAVIHIRRRCNSFGLTRQHLRPRRTTLRAILAVGIPVAVQDGCIQVAFLVITIIANMRGLDDAAAVGIVEKIICMLFLVPSAMLSTVSTLAAQSMGADDHQMARRIFAASLRICIVYGLVVALVMQVWAEPVVGLFTNANEVKHLGEQYLRSYSWDCILAGIQFCFSGLFCAYGYASISFVHNLLSIVLARVPLSYAFSEHYPDTLFPMGLAAPIGSLLSVIICISCFVWLCRRGYLFRSIHKVT